MATLSFQRRNLYPLKAHIHDQCLWILSITGLWAHHCDLAKSLFSFLFSYNASNGSKFLTRHVCAEMCDVIVPLFLTQKLRIILRDFRLWIQSPFVKCIQWSNISIKSFYELNICWTVKMIINTKNTKVQSITSTIRQFTYLHVWSPLKIWWNKFFLTSGQVLYCHKTFQNTRSIFSDMFITVWTA